MAPKNRRWKQLSAARTALVLKKNDQLNVNPVPACLHQSIEDCVELLALTDDEQDESCIASIEKSILQWKEGAGKHLRGVYTVTERTARLS